ncbi:BQ2448_3624 [Microbotryum intermedium]|uniref:Guanine nucleotide-binding protein-like 1 n=1 Tax=Microbotryum intermedium TaxID=269621 RepID=A0A238FAI5_9BASI|nr:BQ2448_3624 [Microbotryum intermedium]
MARRKPNSAKNKKQKLQAHRATKRDQHDQQQTTQSPSTATLVTTDTSTTSRNRSVLVGASARASTSSSSNSTSVLVRKRHAFPSRRTPQDMAKANGKIKLESRFLKLPLDLIQHFRLVASTQPLERPVDSTKGILREEELLPLEFKGLQDQLTCPKRPKWKYTMTKLEVEKNEGQSKQLHDRNHLAVRVRLTHPPFLPEGMFNKWLESTDQLLAQHAEMSQAAGPLRTSPSFYERNLQVWRQLWRVSEASSILLILVDVRFPLIHYPPALEHYVKTLRPKKKVILVLTKTDLVPPYLATAWMKYFQEREGPCGAQVVPMQAYREIERTSLTQGTQARYVPAAPSSNRHDLLGALKKAHQELLEPPEVVRDDPERFKRWSPRVRRKVEWDQVEDEETVRKRDEERNRMERRGDAEVRTGIRGGKKSRRAKKVEGFLMRKKEGVGEEEVKEEEEDEEEEEQEGDPDAERIEPASEGEGDEDEDEAFPYLTVGLIGQPNVGKSSLLNALLGKKVVRASRTPGKTKTLQTIFWNSTIRLCDCPGLVCPSFAGMERQVLSGILPIQNVEPVLHFVAQRMPLEKPLKIHHPSDDPTAFDDTPPPEWTTDSLLTEYALSQGFITAKAGRPDLYRAGAFVLRQLHSSSIPWGFRPLFKEGDVADQGEEEGIWLKSFVSGGMVGSEREERRRGRLVGDGEEESGSGSGSGESAEEEGGSEDVEADGNEVEVEDEKAARAVLGAFAALEVEEEDEDDEDDEEEEDRDGDASEGSDEEEEDA